MYAVSMVTLCTLFYEVLICNFKEQFSVISGIKSFHFHEIHLGKIDFRNGGFTEILNF
jgi:hypothetical protein